VENLNLSILLVLGISLFGGLVGASFFQRIRTPQVVGYIVIGLILGESGFKLVSHADVIALRPFTLFALGIIGFLVGGELQSEKFRKYGKQFFAILLGEGLGAFVLVSFPSSLVMYHVSHNASIALASGIVFGAIASATDPASTIYVLWEYRSLGVVTTSLTAVVALDDALAMTLYGLGTGAAEILAGGHGSILAEVGKVSISLAGAVAVGLICALILRALLRWVQQPEKSLAFAVGLILLAIGAATYLDIDVILTTMTLGCAVTNLSPHKSKDLFEITRSFSIPIYVLFFVLAGARLGVSSMPGWLWLIVVLYVVGRSAGKMVGAYFGARQTGSEPAVRRYLGLGLFAQGGVAIGLSVMASQHLAGIQAAGDLALGDAIIFGVAATTLIVQLIGPPMVKLAITLSGEVGRNVTREDVINSWTVADAMDADVIVIQDREPLARAAQIFADHDYLVYPVVDRNGGLVGVLSLESLKEVLTDQESWNWLVASDVMQPVEEKMFPSAPLREALDHMFEIGVEQLPVVQEHNHNIPVGILDVAKVRQRVEKEIVRRQRPARKEQALRVN